MVAPAFAELGADVVPVGAVRFADRVERLVDAVLHALVAADVDERVVVLDQLREVIAAAADAVLDVLFLCARLAAKGELEVDQVVGQLLERPEIGQLALGPRAEEQPDMAAVVGRALAPPALDIALEIGG